MLPGSSLGKLEKSVKENKPARGRKRTFSTVINTTPTMVKQELNEVFTMLLCLYFLFCFLFSPPPPVGVHRSRMKSHVCSLLLLDFIFQVKLFAPAFFLHRDQSGKKLADNISPVSVYTT